MILSAQSIRKKVDIIVPFFEKTIENGMSFGLGPAGYDIRIKEDIILDSHGFSLASTIEYFNIPNDILAIVHDKSTWARYGLTVQNTVIEPGWKGYLTLELTNHSSDTITIISGSPIAQIIFHKLDEETEIPYNGKYQNQKSGVQKAIIEKK